DLRRAADVERAHGQLRARLTDRLRRDDAHGLADVDRRAAREIAPIAGRAYALFGFADQRRTDTRRLHADFLDQLDRRLVQQRAGRDDRAAVLAGDILRQCPAEDTLAQRGDGRTALNDRAHFQ